MPEVIYPMSWGSRGASWALSSAPVWIQPCIRVRTCTQVLQGRSCDLSIDAAITLLTFYVDRLLSEQSLPRFALIKPSPFVPEPVTSSPLGRLPTSSAWELCLTWPACLLFALHLSTE